MTRMIQGYRVGERVPERVLEKHGLAQLTDVETLVLAASKYDQRNKGYLSRDELTLGAKELAQSLDGAFGGYRYASGQLKRALGDVKDRTGRPVLPPQLIAAAALHDDGNRYLNAVELDAGVADLIAPPERPGTVDLYEMEPAQALQVLEGLCPGIDFVEVRDEAFSRMDFLDPGDGSYRCLATPQFGSLDPIEGEPGHFILVLNGRCNFDFRPHTFLATYEIDGEACRFVRAEAVPE